MFFIQIELKIIVKFECHEFVTRYINLSRNSRTDIFYINRITNYGTNKVFDSAASGFHLEPVQGKDSFMLTFSGENRGTTTLVEMQLSLSYPGFEKVYSFSHVESSQTVFDYIEVPSDSRLLNGDYELTLKVLSKNGDDNLANNVKTARIRLTNRSSEGQ